MQGYGRLAALLAGVAAVAPMQAHAEVHRFRADPVLGTSFELVAVTPDRCAALVAVEAARAEIARLDAILSGWRGDSELSALNGAEQAQVSPELFEVLAACEAWREKTGGAFDARQGEAFALWRGADAEPEREALQRLAQAASDADVALDPATRTVRRSQAVRFAPEALAKGYVIDAALTAARKAAPGVSGLLIDIGGDLRCWGRGPDGEAWTVGVADPASPEDNAAPATLLRLDGRALATSGRSERDARIGEARFSHVLARGGQPAGIVSASVVAPTAADADALATALCAMPADEGLALVESLPDVEARVIETSDQARRSSGWASLELTGAAPRLIRTAAAAAAPWPRGFGLTINYVLPNQGARAYSPYVAIWVTDENNQLVKALTMLGDNLDYVPENYIWWRRYGRSRPQLVAAVSRPTRPAGRYAVVWDGRDDSGRAVGQGRYTVHIEATREEGVHSYQSMNLTLGSAPLQAMAAAEDELGAASVRYGAR